MPRACHGNECLPYGPLARFPLPKQSCKKKKTTTSAGKDPGLGESNVLCGWEIEMWNSWGNYRAASLPIPIPIPIQPELHPFNNQGRNLSFVVALNLLECSLLKWHSGNSKRINIFKPQIFVKKKNYIFVETNLISNYFKTHIYLVPVFQLAIV